MLPRLRSQAATPWQPCLPPQQGQKQMRRRQRMLMWRWRMRISPRMMAAGGEKTQVCARARASSCRGGAWSAAGCTACSAALLLDAPRYLTPFTADAVL